MDEVEITAGKSSISNQEYQRNEPLDKRKHRTNSESNESMKCAVYIKDEVDIFEVEEDEDMDPLEVEEIENESLETIMGPSQMFSVTNMEQKYYNTGTLSEYPSRKGSNG